MKKIVGIIAAAALATSAFAEINIGLESSAGWAPFAYDGEDVVTAGTTYGWNNALTKYDGKSRTGISFKAENEVAGVVADIHTEDGGRDNGYAWIKPFSFLKVSAGLIDTSWKRVGFGYGGWNGALRVIMPGHEGDDLAFWRPDHSRVAVTLTPVEGLEIQYDWLTGDDGNKIYGELWNNARYGAAYTITDVGTIMAQIYGKNPGTNSDGDKVDYGVVNAAFQLNGIEGLDAQLGFAAPTCFKPLIANGKTTSDPVDDDLSTAIKIGAGVTYNFAPIAVHAFFDGRLVSDDAKDYNKFGFGVGGGLDFAITDAYKLIGDVRFYNAWYKGTEKKDTVAFYAGLEHSLTNATFKLGFTGATNNGGTGDDFVCAVPLQVNVSF